MFIRRNNVLTRGGTSQVGPTADVAPLGSLSNEICFGTCRYLLDRYFLSVSLKIGEVLFCDRSYIVLDVMSIFLYFSANVSITNRGLNDEVSLYSLF